MYGIAGTKHVRRRSRIVHRTLAAAECAIVKPNGGGGCRLRANVPRSPYPDSRLALEIALGHPPAPRPERCGYHKLSEAQRRTQERRSQSLPRGACQSPCQGVRVRIRYRRWSTNSAIHVEATFMDPTRFVASTRCNDVNNTPFTRNLYRTAERKRAPLYERCGPWRSPQRSWLKGDTVKLKEGRFDG